MAKKTASGSGSCVMSCNCTNVQQDSLHGKGRRVCNKTSKEKEYRCTSCSANKTK